MSQWREITKNLNLRYDFFNFFRCSVEVFKGLYTMIKKKEIPCEHTNEGL